MTSDGAVCSGPGEIVCYDACTGIGACITGTLCPEQPPCR
jgi:hypothetical protein